jgi:hypothetical protein
VGLPVVFGRGATMVARVLRSHSANTTPIPKEPQFTGSLTESDGGKIYSEKQNDQFWKEIQLIYGVR